MNDEKTSPLASIYPQLACQGLEATATELTLSHRNSKPNPQLTIALLRGATTACRNEGIVSDEHAAAVTEQMETWVHNVLPHQWVETSALPPGAEKNRSTSMRERRRLILDMFGDSPMPLLAAWMTAIAREQSKDTPQRATARAR